MTPEERELLHRAVELGEENNALLKKMHRSAIVTLILRICYWGVIIFLSFGAYYFIQPYLNQIMSLYGSTTGEVNTVSTLTNTLKNYLPK
jgi:cystathionine beta-lyase/cystathionine gamma-synthase